jgi:hypothetical protein
MPDYPKDPLSFRDQFHSEAACREFLIRVRWPEGWLCPKCGGQDSWIMMRGVLCRQSSERYVSVTAGTFFADTHKPLRL